MLPAGFSSKSTVSHLETEEGLREQQVGVMLNGFVIEGLVVGGPAFSSQALARGDEILAVDDQPASSSQVLHALLRGDDVPGSQVKLSFRKQGKVNQPSLGHSLHAVG